MDLLNPDDDRLLREGIMIALHSPAVSLFPQVMTISREAITIAAEHFEAARVALRRAGILLTLKAAFRDAWALSKQRGARGGFGVIGVASRYLRNGTGGKSAWRQVRLKHSVSQKMSKKSFLSSKEQSKASLQFSKMYLIQQRFGPHH